MPFPFCPLKLKCKERRLSAAEALPKRPFESPAKISQVDFLRSQSAESAIHLRRPPEGTLPLGLAQSRQWNAPSALRILLRRDPGALPQAGNDQAPLALKHPRAASSLRISRPVFPVCALPFARALSTFTGCRLRSSNGRQRVSQ